MCPRSRGRGGARGASGRHGARGAGRSSGSRGSSLGGSGDVCFLVPAVEEDVCL